VVVTAAAAAVGAVVVVVVITYYLVHIFILSKHPRFDLVHPIATVRAFLVQS
jgi:hypothetical protein